MEDAKYLGAFIVLLGLGLYHLLGNSTNTIIISCIPVLVGLAFILKGYGVIEGPKW